MPTLHLCHPSTAPTGLPLLHIMARPPAWVVELTGGRHVPELCPQGEEVAMMRRLVSQRKAGTMDADLLAAYRQAYMLRLFARLEAWHTAEHLQDDLQSPLTGSVALLCTCTPAEARSDRCHRAWAAAVLMLAGWEVVVC